MNKKSIIIHIFTIIFSIIVGYSLVYGVGAFFGDDIKVTFKLSNNIYIDSLYLNENKLAIKSNYDISEYSFDSTCQIKSQYISKSEDLYFFSIKYFNNKCDSDYIYLKDSNNKIVLTLKFNIIDEYKLYSVFIDNTDEKLNYVYNALLKKSKDLSIYSGEYDKNSKISYYTFLINNRTLNEVLYNLNILKSIINSRQEKYMIPLEGSSLPTNSNKLPNSSRPYRADYTDGIHHGWDFDGEFGQQVLAIDDGIIVRVVSGFNYNDLNLIEKGNDLTDFDKTKNLDILRGNQVWLKTSKGDVVFYSHLNDIFTNIKEGVVVRRGQPLGTIGISGVPDKYYTDYHLHLPIQKNPHDPKMVGKYDYDDYMNWDWNLKGFDSDTVMKSQLEVFSS